VFSNVHLPRPLIGESVEVAKLVGIKFKFGLSGVVGALANEFGELEPEVDGDKCEVFAGSRTRANLNEVNKFVCLEAGEGGTGR
jgi:hypothetical protein